MSTINFISKLSKIDSWTILSLPKSASEKLPSRGMVMVKGTINGFELQTPLEPDGKGSHWFFVDKEILEAIDAKEGDEIELRLEVVKDWPEPNVPLDLFKALKDAPKAHEVWSSITPMARWDWIRWINATKVSDTRKKRIEVACSKLKSGMRRPCCFNRTQCTNPYVSHGGMLLD